SRAGDVCLPLALRTRIASALGGIDRISLRMCQCQQPPNRDPAARLPERLTVEAPPLREKVLDGSHRLRAPGDGEQRVQAGLAEAIARGGVVHARYQELLEAAAEGVPLRFVAIPEVVTERDRGAAEDEIRDLLVSLPGQL